jgi:hypothetical protein
LRAIYEALGQPEKASQYQEPIVAKAATPAAR